jgi:Ca2+-binding EF-hand superfamily protein
VAEKYDANRDGRVTAAEYTRSALSFERLDRDGDGALTPADFAEEHAAQWRDRYMQAPQLQERLIHRFQTDDAPGLSRGEFLRRLAASDLDGNARLDGAEFALLVPKPVPPPADAPPPPAGEAPPAQDDWPAFALFLGAAPDASLAHEALAAAFDVLDINRDGFLVPPDHPDRDLPLKPDGKPLALVFGSFT